MKTDEINNKLYKKKEKPQRKIDWGRSISKFVDEYDMLAFIIFMIILSIVFSIIVYLFMLIPKEALPYIFIALGICAVIWFIWSVIHKFKKVMVHKTDNDI